MLGVLVLGVLCCCGVGGLTIGTTPVGRISGRFVSFTMDAYMFHVALKGYNFSDPVTRKLAREMGSAYLRVGGTMEDYLTYQDADGPYAITPHSLQQICGFVEATGWGLVFGLNNMKGYNDSAAHRWDPTNAERLMRYVRSIRCPVVGWELGNEDDLTNQPGKGVFTPLLEAQHFQQLQSLVAKVYEGDVGKGTADSPFLIGPDCTHNAVGAHGSRPFFFRDFLRNQSVVNVATWHHYFSKTTTLEQLTTPSFLDGLVPLVSAANSAVTEYRARVGSAEVWLGETGLLLNNKAEQHTVCGWHPVGTTCYYGGVMPWLDKLGLAALHGHSVVARQTFGVMVQQVKGAVVTSPEYWSSLLFKRLVGTASPADVLRVTGAPSNTRAYAFCGDGGKVAYLLNLNNTTATVTVPSTHPTTSVYTLTSYPTASNYSETRCALNSVPLEHAPDGTTPPLTPRTQPSSQPVKVPARSVVFLHLGPCDKP